MPRRQPLDLTQEGGAIGRGQEHAALPFDRAVGAGAVNRTGRGGVAASIRKSSSLPSTISAAASRSFDVVQNDRAALHAAASLIQRPARGLQKMRRFRKAAARRSPVKEPLKSTE